MNADTTGGTGPDRHSHPQQTRHLPVRVGLASKDWTLSVMPGRCPGGSEVSTRQELTEERIRQVHYLRALVSRDELAIAATETDVSPRSYIGLLTATLGILRLVEDPEKVLDALLFVSLHDAPPVIP